MEVLSFASEHDAKAFVIYRHVDGKPETDPWFGVGFDISFFDVGEVLADGKGNVADIFFVTETPEVFRRDKFAHA